MYDAMPSVGRKFLMAGKSGLNITHAEAFEHFVARYFDKSDALRPLLNAFGPDQLREWVHGLGIDTFVGSSGRVFPNGMKAAPLLRAWLHRLRVKGVRFHVRHRWVDWRTDNSRQQLCFQTQDGKQSIEVDAVVLALGGASWPKLGSDGAWVAVLQQQNVKVAPLKPANCGFNVAWSDSFRNAFACVGTPIKAVAARCIGLDGIEHRRRGEFIVTADGVEGGLIYALSAYLRDRISADGHATLYLDLAPDIDLINLIDKLSSPRGKNSFANHMRKKAGIHGVKAGLMRERLAKEAWSDPKLLAENIKSLPLDLLTPRPIEEAISTAGGVSFEELDEHLMLHRLPGVFCAGEMLDWEAPTGGYLLTACFASGRAAGFGVVKWLTEH
ncbi:MAG: TIGR03862 family flavoprotein [Gammaproteobacteria bacterium]